MYILFCHLIGMVAIIHSIHFCAICLCFIMWICSSFPQLFPITYVVLSILMYFQAYIKFGHVVFDADLVLSVVINVGNEYLL